MTLIRYRNNNLLPSLRDLDSFFEPFFRDGLFSGKCFEEAFMPAVNIATEGDDYLISAELPGVKAEEVEVNFEKGVLSISGEKKFDHEDDGKDYHRVESCYGKFYRKIRLPSGADGDQITASFEDGVLKIRVKKSESVKAKQISIETK